MKNDVSIDNKILRTQGVKLTVLSVIIGCTLFVVIDTLPWVIKDSASFDIVIVLVIFANLFALPFSITGGYVLGWFLEKTQWYRYGNVKVIASGVLIAIATFIFIFTIGAFIQLFLMAHMHPEIMFNAIKSIIFDSSSEFTSVRHLFIQRFVSALAIAMVCGGIVAWRLSQLAQQ
jgi:hypothetical protein